jgi:hypothetical protein
MPFLLFQVGIAISGYITMWVLHADAKDCSLLAG